jgi:serine protease Do
MKFMMLILAGALITVPGYSSTPAGEIFGKNRDAICLVSYYQNIASDAKIGSFDKLKRYRIGIMVDSSGLVMVSNDVYPVSLDMLSTGGSLLSAMPTDFEVKLVDGNEFPAQFMGKDDQAKIAFIKISDKKNYRTFSWVDFFPTASLDVADSVFVLELLGQSYNFSPLFTPHIINAVIETPRRKFLINNYSLSLSAGGLVLDSRGRAIGITIKEAMDFSFMQPEDFEDFHHDYLEIAPSEWFMDLIDNPPDLQENELTQKSWLGIEMQALTRELKDYWKIPQEGGIIINNVFSQSPAEAANLKTGDIILAVDDSTLNVENDEETAMLRNLILSQTPGTTVTMKIFRNGKIFRQKVKLVTAPKAIGLAESYPVPQLGFEIRYLTRDILYADKLRLNTPGVFVYQVDRASPAGIGGLAIGDIIQEINSESINNLEEAKHILVEALKTNKQMYMLKVLSNHRTRFVFIDLKK